MVYHELMRLERRHMPTEFHGEFSALLAMRLQRSRPGPRRFTSSDDHARAYLITGLNNLLLDRHRARQRARKRFVPLATTDTSGKEHDRKRHDVDRVNSPHERLVADQRERQIAEATRQLFDRAIPAISGSLQNPKGFLANIADLRAIFDGDLDVDAIVRREGGTDATYVTVRNRVYQRHKRARAYLLEVPRNKPGDVPRLTEWLAGAGLPEHLAEEVRRLASEVFAPRVDRGDSVPSQEQVS